MLVGGHKARREGTGQQMRQRQRACGRLEPGQSTMWAATTGPGGQQWAAPNQAAIGWEEGSDAFRWGLCYGMETGDGRGP